MLSTLWRRLSNGLTQNATAAYFRAHRNFQSCGCCNENKPPLYGMYVCILPAPKTDQGNYMYLIIDAKSKEAAVVDPIEPDCVLKTVEKAKVCLKHVFITHFHCDHQGGNAELAYRHKGKLSFWGIDKRIAGLTNCITPNKEIKVGRLCVRFLSIPCHTKGDIAYLVQDPCGGSAVFTGDVVFCGGCGPIIEGTPKQLYAAMKIMCSLDNNTELYGGHENTVENLTFAMQVEPENDCIISKLKWAEDQIEMDKPTYPSTIGQEKRFNPFFRFNYPNVQKYAGSVGMDPVAVLDILDRDRKKHGC